MPLFQSALNNPDLGALLSQAQDLAEGSHVLLAELQQQVQEARQHNQKLQQLLLTLERRKAFRRVQNQKD